MYDFYIYTHLNNKHTLLWVIIFQINEANSIVISNCAQLEGKQYMKFTISVWIFILFKSNISSRHIGDFPGLSLNPKCILILTVKGLLLFSQFDGNMTISLTSEENKSVQNDSQITVKILSYFPKYQHCLLFWYTYKNGTSFRIEF